MSEPRGTKIGRSEALEGRPARRYGRLETIVVIVALATIAFVVLQPTAAYSPTARVVLLLLASPIPATLFGAIASTQFKMQLPGFAFATGGAAALVLGSVIVLYNLAKQDYYVARFNVVDDRGKDIELFPYITPGAGELRVEGGDFFVNGNTLVVLIRDGTSAIRVRMKPVQSDMFREGVLKFEHSEAARKLVVGNEVVSEGE